MWKKQFFILATAAVLTACSSTQHQQDTPYHAMARLFMEEASLSEQEFIEQLYNSRTWMNADHLETNSIVVSHAYSTPINNAEAKIIGVDYEESVLALATKLWLIDNAEHTLDLTYFIFKYDKAGEAILGSLCNAVQRGVDVRIMVDSVGSLNSFHNPMKALKTCEAEAGYFKDSYGNDTEYKARVQFVIINALSSHKSWGNRRSHDKLIVKDGHFVGKDAVVTGGRNISLDYFGIDAKGQPNPDSYLDLEVIMRSSDRNNNKNNNVSLGEISSLYYSMLFLHEGNRYIVPSNTDGFSRWRSKAQRSLSELMLSPDLKQAYESMDSYMQTGFEPTQARLAHQLENFSSTNVVEDVRKIKSENTNSIEGILDAAIQQILETEDREAESVLRIVSPYIFTPQYKNRDGEIIYDGAVALKEFLDEFPNFRVEILTNSILTSDNFFTQSVIDMDTAPRLLLSDELREIWINSMSRSELNPDYINSKAWLDAVNDPRIQIYQTGLRDSAIIGGDQNYGKLHAKFFFGEQYGFVGTSNFDYRSSLYNNEMGYYFYGEELSEQLLENYNKLKAHSLRWGSPEWLQMRQDVFNSLNQKNATSKTQRARFRIMQNSGLIWLF